MRLSFVELVASNYDPRSDTAGISGRSEFSAADGYVITLEGEVLSIEHSGRAAVFPWALAKFGLRAEGLDRGQVLTQSLDFATLPSDQAPAFRKAVEEADKQRCTHDGVGLPECSTCDPRPPEKQRKGKR